VQPSAAHSQAKHVTADEFDRVIVKAAVPAVVDFWAEWCGQCHAMAPLVDKLAAEFAGRAIVAKVDAEAYPDLLGRYGVMGIPALLFFKEGAEIERVVGVPDYNTLKSKLERALG
jgi:thioredoxin 1